MSTTSKYPKIRGGEKRALHVSPSVVLRERDPTNDFTASKVPHMVFDYSRQQRVWPDARPDALIENTQNDANNERNYRTINRSGKPFALGVDVGGSPDPRGEAFRDGQRRKMTEAPANGRGTGPRKPNGQR